MGAARQARSASMGHDRPADSVMPALVSIGVPVRNGAPLIDRALVSLRAQTWPNLEIVVSDNASTDATEAILERHAAEDSRVVVSRTDRVLTAYENFQRVLELTSGELFMWAAHDDLWQPEHVGRLAPALIGDDGVALAAAVTEVIDEQDRRLWSFDTVVDIERDDVLERACSFVAQPEIEGKANLIYGLFRRGDLTALDLSGFLARDRRREDYHVVLSVLLNGRLWVDRDLRFRKMLADARPAPRGRRLLEAVTATTTAIGWITAYPGVARESGILEPSQLRVLRATARRALWGYVRWRVRFILGGPGIGGQRR